MPTGEYRLVSPEALFDVGVLDPMLQPGSGSWDLVRRVFPGSNLILVSDVNGGLFVVEYTGS